MEEKTRVETQKFREDVEKKINSFVQDEKTAKLEFPPMEKFQVCRSAGSASCLSGSCLERMCKNTITFLISFLLKAFCIKLPGCRPELWILKFLLCLLGGKEMKTPPVSTTG